MSKEIGEHVRLRFATAVTGAVFLLSGLGNVTEKTSSQPSEYLIPVPCTEPLPWDPNYKENNQSQIGEIELASIMLPKPTPNRNRDECWKIVKDNGITQHPYNSPTIEIIPPSRAELIPLARPGDDKVEFLPLAKPVIIDHHQQS